MPNISPKQTKKPEQVKWTSAFDIASVPDDVLLSESARRVRSRNKRAPRPKVLRQCQYCLKLFGTREMRAHIPRCPNRGNPLEPARKDWTVQKVTDPDEQDMRTYRYWQKRTPGERIVATWELSKEAYAFHEANKNVI